MLYAEVTAAFIGLPNRWLDARAQQPVQLHRPSRSPIAKQRQHHLFSAAAGAFETGPLFESGVVHHVDRVVAEFIGRRVPFRALRLVGAA